MTERKTLNIKEYEVLCKIITRNKLDCWCYIDLREDFNDKIYDIENNKYVPLSEGVQDIAEALDCPENWENCRLSLEEKEVFLNLCRRLNVIYTDPTAMTKDQHNVHYVNHPKLPDDLIRRI